MKLNVPKRCCVGGRYWTDNMAYYDWYHWFPNVDKDGKPQDVLIQLDKVCVLVT